jgi:hypothetical protein
MYTRCPYAYVGTYDDAVVVGDGGGGRGKDGEQEQAHGLEGLLRLVRERLAGGIGQHAAQRTQRLCIHARIDAGQGPDEGEEHVRAQPDGQWKRRGGPCAAGRLASVCAGIVHAQCAACRRRIGPGRVCLGGPLGGGARGGGTLGCWHSWVRKATAAAARHTWSPYRGGAAGTLRGPGARRGASGR